MAPRKKTITPRTKKKKAMSLKRGEEARKYLKAKASGDKKTTSKMAKSNGGRVALDAAKIVRQGGHTDRKANAMWGPNATEAKRARTPQLTNRKKIK